MSARNKIIAEFWLPAGNNQDLDEVEVSWMPVNFAIYSPLFLDLISEAIDEWKSAHKMQHDTLYEVIFAHEVERDGAGAVHTEYFEPIHTETASGH